MEESPLAAESAPIQQDTQPLQEQKNQFIDALKQQLSGIEKPEDRLQVILTAMQESLAQQGAPNFRNFWDARALCGDLFRQVVAPTIRSNLWTQYTELSKEARRLKHVLDEQSAFAVEQIELAIKGIEQEMALNVRSSYACPVASRFLQQRLPQYEELQQELDQLNTYATRVAGLRKELANTSMRIRKKNELFEHLSGLGDRLFPRRKELMQKVSQQFLEDIRDFRASQMPSTEQRQPLFGLLDEIKALQSMSKWLTLTPAGFNQARQELSGCWDQVKQLDQERRQERAELRVASQQIVEQLKAKVKEIVEQFSNGALLAVGALDQLRELGGELRSRDLFREDQAYLRDFLQKAQQPMQEQLQRDEEARLGREREMLQKRQHDVAQLRVAVGDLHDQAEVLEADRLMEQIQGILEQVQQSVGNKQERMEFDRLLKPLRDLVAEKKEQHLMNLSEGDRQALQQLHVVLRQRRERRLAVKEQLEQLRKMKGASDLDFTRAMEYNSLLQEEKERLEKINQGILEIEQRINSLASGGVAGG